MTARVQFRLSYSEVEDRILYSGTFADGQEMNLWFTRRLTLGFLELADRVSVSTSGVSANPTAMKEVAAFQKDAAMQSADLSTPYDGGAPHQELGEAPLLVTKVTVKPEGEGRITLTFGLADKRQISFPVARDVFLTIWNLIDELVRKKTGWLSVQSPMSQHRTDHSGPGDGDVLH